MKLIQQYLAIGLAGALGAVFRFFVSTVCGRLFGNTFPVGTFVINISGSLFLGWFFTVVSERVVISETLRLAVAVGFVGAYTTFSTFMYESSSLFEDGSWFKGTFNLAGSLFAGLLCVRIGIWLGGR